MLFPLLMLLILAAITVPLTAIAIGLINQTQKPNWTGFSDLELYFDVIIPKGSNNTATILINNTGVYQCAITNHTQCTAFDYGNTNSSDILAEILDPQRWQLLS